MAKPRSNTYAKACKTKVSSFSAATYHQHPYQKNLLNAHLKPLINYASVVWDGCGEVHLKKKSELLAWKGRRMNSSLSFPIYRSKDECTWNFTSCSRSITKKEYLCIQFLIIIPQTTWHNSLLVTSPTH